jgi:GT2 family glycosyltransferase
VIIPTKDRSAQLRLTVEALFEQQCDEDFEIVVVDNGSTDDTRQVLERLSETSPVPMSWEIEPRPGPASARNTAVRRSSGEILLLLGDDTEPASEDLLQRHVSLHRQGADASRGVLGRMAWSPKSEITEFMAWLDDGGPQFHFFEIDPGPVDPGAFFYSSHLSLRREVFFSVGGFDERFPFAAFEDSELGTRLAATGWVLEYHPELLAWHDHPTTIETSLDRAERAGRSAAIYNAIHPDDNNSRIREPSRLKRALAVVGSRPVAAVCHLPVPIEVKRRIWMLAHRFHFARGYRAGPPEPL